MILMYDLREPLYRIYIVLLANVHRHKGIVDEVFRIIHFQGFFSLCFSFFLVVILLLLFEEPTARLTWLLSYANWLSITNSTINLKEHLYWALYIFYNVCYNVLSCLYK